jgi:hypothetical protein
MNFQNFHRPCTENGIPKSLQNVLKPHAEVQTMTMTASLVFSTDGLPQQRASVA